MRYLYVVFAALSAATFVALQIPERRIGIQFLTSFIDLPANSLATLSFVLGVVAGVFLALSVSSLIGTHGRRIQSLASHSQAGA